MKAITLILVLTAALLACNNKTTKVDTKTLVVASDKASVKYQCPMKCEGDTAYTTIGKCPVCEMDLEKK